MNDSNRPGPPDSDMEPSLGPDVEGRYPEGPARVPPGADMTKKTSSSDPSAVPGWERAALEKLVFASLNEQKAARRWKTFVRLSWLAFLIALVWMALHRGAPTSDASVHAG